MNKLELQEGYSRVKEQYEKSPEDFNIFETNIEGIRISIQNTYENDPCISRLKIIAWARADKVNQKLYPISFLIPTLNFEIDPKYASIKKIVDNKKFLNIDNSNLVPRVRRIEGKEFLPIAAISQQEEERYRKHLFLWSHIDYAQNQEIMQLLFNIREYLEGVFPTNYTRNFFDIDFLIKQKYEIKKRLDFSFAPDTTYDFSIDDIEDFEVALKEYYNGYINKLLEDIERTNEEIIEKVNSRDVEIYQTNPDDDIFLILNKAPNA